MQWRGILNCLWNHLCYRWLRSSFNKLWDGEPMCRGPGDLGGNPVGDLRYSDLCDGQWASMLSLAPRIPKNKITLADVKSPYEYLQENYTNATILKAAYAAAAAAAEAAAAKERYAVNDAGNQTTSKSLH